MKLTKLDWFFVLLMAVGFLIDMYVLHRQQSIDMIIIALIAIILMGTLNKINDLKIEINNLKKGETI